jgi:predicted DNA-binding protein
MSKPIPKLRGEHCLNLFISYQLKERIKKLAEKYDRTMTGMIRLLIKVGIPVMEGLTEAEENLLKHSIASARRMRNIRQMKIEEDGYEDNHLKTET